jgi:hypothetical protein
MRNELYWVGADQGLPRDAAFVVIAAIDVGALDDRQYREAQLAAGLVEGRLHLLAYALHASASGMTFYDSEVTELLGERLEPLLFTCVGVPEYTPKPGGPPGAPTEFRAVTPRDELRLRASLRQREGNAGSPVYRSARDPRSGSACRHAVPPSCC